MTKPNVAAMALGGVARIESIAAPVGADLAVGKKPTI